MIRLLKMCATRSRSDHSAVKRPRGRPRKTLEERNEGLGRQAIIKAAAKLFRRHGFNGTSTRDIACAVGMHSGSLYCHFKSKDALLYEVMQEGLRSAVARQMIVLLAEHDAATTLRQLIRSHFDTLLGPNSDFMQAVLYESRSLNTRQRNVIAKLQGDYEAAWTPVLQELSLTGCLQAEVPLARHLLFGALNWSVQWFDAKNGASLDDLTDAVMALMIRKKSR
ncbi:TetR/AcrR family transcriptional regulator [Polaromonas sp.]|uniref:TetR/AcrR family transcriptional regulator n=1 Tax=Polaromonas sp. TaxID=1869339 RepID=UPI00273080D2|nr:TetR/AcrR family transcriptional regulator [Polaromonas sp.]MDP2451338.1 TetR/AcrR family transcriptional regulator [Polaromonas sp.]